jgi:hypothetical protein
MKRTKTEMTAEERKREARKEKIRVRIEQKKRNPGKPEFELDYPIELRDAVILETRKENLKTEKPQKRKQKRVYKML